MTDSIYDDLDPLYRAIWGSSLHHGLWKTSKENTSEAKENLIQKILTHWQPTGHLADIGCGYGTLAHRFLQDFDCSITACTSSPVQAAAIPSANRLQILNGSWLDQHIPPQSLDSAIALESISHFADFHALLKKTHFSLKPGATWLISDWFSDQGHTPLLQHLAKSGKLPPWRSLQTFLAAARHHGFTISKTLDLSQKVAPTWTALFWKSLALPFLNPKLIPQLIIQLLHHPALLWSSPLLRLAYQQKKLSYHLITLTKSESLSSRP